MPTTTRTFRVFVSSTFEDLRDERNILQATVFPKLETFCLEKGARFQAIDLRWGVREEAGLDQKTMDICLAEIARCQKTGIKPNFIVLLGNRYGWRPLPTRIQQDEFESVLAHVANTGERDFVASWYDLDRNAVPPEHLLKPRKGIYTDWGEWEPVEQRIHRALREGARAAGLSPQSLIKYEASATHQEILKGLGETSEDRAHVFAFFRESGGDEDPDLTKLKDHLKAVLPAENVFPWSVGDHPRLCDDAERSLKTVIGATSAQFETQSEKVSHDRFAEDRAKHFKGRETVLDAIEQYLLGEDRRPLVVFGPSGSGKSAIMAVASEGKNAIRRFIGATPESSSGITLLRSLCRELGERFGQTGDLPATFNELSTMFAERLKLAAVEQPIILFIDALDQLSAQDPAAAVRWLPAELPPDCHVVLSTTQIPEALRRAAMVTVEPLPLDDASHALDAWLTEASRALQPEQREKLLASFLQSGLPLYLKLAFEEARLWQSFDLPRLCVLGEGLPGIIDRLFARLSDRANHGEILVSHAMGYLTAARYGLTEDEILAVLTKDDVVWNDVVGSGERQRHDPPLRQLPVIVWSRLHLDLEPYLTERAVPGGTTVSFYHRQLAERICDRHRAEQATWHIRLAEYFESIGRGVRTVLELPWQLTITSSFPKLHELLLDLDFASRMIGQSEDDFLGYWLTIERETRWRMGSSYDDALQRYFNPNPNDVPDAKVDVYALLRLGYALISAAYLLPAGRIFSALAHTLRAKQEPELLASALLGAAQSLDRVPLPHHKTPQEPDSGMIVLLREAEELFTAVRDQQGVATCRLVAAQLYRQAGLHSQSLELLESAESNACGEDRVTVAIDRSTLLYDAGRYEEASDVLDQLRARLKNEGDRGGLQTCLGNIGMVRRKLRDITGALSALQEQEQICRELGFAKGLTNSLWGQALIMAEEQQDPLAAHPLLVSAAEVAQDHGLDKMTTFVAGYLGGRLVQLLSAQAERLVRERDMDRALIAHRLVAAISKDNSNWEDLASALANQAILLGRYAGSRDAARTLIEEALLVASNNSLIELVGPLQKVKSEF